MAQAKRNYYLSGVCRIIWGHPAMNPQTQNYETKAQLVTKDGKPYVKYNFGAAIPKFDIHGQQNPDWINLWNSVCFEAASLYGQNHPAIMQPNFMPNTGFSWKIRDGDAINPDTGQPIFPGHWVITFSKVDYPSKLHDNTPECNVIAPEAIKTGDFVRVNYAVTSNDSAANPGIHINHSYVQLVGYGDPLGTGPSGKEVFGGQFQGQLPQGASLQPTAPTNAPAGQGGPPQGQYGQPPAQQYSQPPQGHQPPAQQYSQPPQGHQSPAGNAPGAYGAAPGAGSPMGHASQGGYAGQPPAGAPPNPAGQYGQPPQGQQGAPGVPPTGQAYPNQGTHPGAYGAGQPAPNHAGQPTQGSGTAYPSNPAGQPPAGAPGQGGPAPDYSMLNPNMGGHPQGQGQPQGQVAPQGGYHQGQYQQ